MNPIEKSRLTFRIEQEAARLGFIACGFAQAEPLEAEARELEAWLRRNLHGSMDYMAEQFDLRVDPTKLMPGARTVVTALLNYWPETTPTASLVPPRIARYALGKDYHQVVHDKLRALLQFIRLEVGDCASRICIDSAPFMDKVWAKRCGLGWTGKNTNLLRAGVGSWFFIGSIILDVDLETNAVSAADRCGTCRRCIDACPTQALEPYRIDATRCISYWTIEARDDPPADIAANLDGWAFGCDVCQEVCPWNSFSEPHREPLFQLLAETERLHGQEEENAFETPNRFFRRMRRSAISRVRRDKWLRNRRLALLSAGEGQSG